MRLNFSIGNRNYKCLLVFLRPEAHFIPTVELAMRRNTVSVDVSLLAKVIPVTLHLKHASKMHYGYTYSGL